MYKNYTMKNNIRQDRTIVLLQGAYDIFNWGHVKSFHRIKKLFPDSFFIVALNSDELLRDYKKREPVLPFYQKKFIIESCKYVDRVIKATEFSPLKLLKQYDVDVYVLTREWEDTKAEEIAYMKSKGGQVVFSPRFKGVICTSDIKKTLLKEAQNGILC